MCAHANKSNSYVYYIAMTTTRVGIDSIWIGEFVKSIIGDVRRDSRYIWITLILLNALIYITF